MNEKKLIELRATIIYNDVFAPEYKPVLLNAINKQLPLERADGWYGTKTECPVCGNVSTSGNYCNSCGQRLT